MFAVFSSAGCDQIRNETGYPGGFVGAEANRVIPAFSTTDRADRYLIALALLAPMAGETARDKASAQASTTSINDSLLTIASLMEANRSECTILPDRAINATCLTEARASGLGFETLSYDAQRNLYALSKQIATNAELPLSYEALAALDVVGLMTDLDNWKQGFVLARRSLAVYRDAIITVADAMKSKACKEDSLGDACTALDIPTQARNFYHSSDTAKQRPLRVAMFKIRELMRDGEDLGLNQSHRFALLFHVKRACEQLVRIQKSSEGTAPTVDCESQDSWAKIKTAIKAVAQ